MDTPKHQLFWLESFPDDIWAYFAWYLPGEQLGRLIMTGSRSLRRRLKSPNVVKSIKLGRDFLVFKSFPRLLYDFPSLQELCLNSVVDDWSDKLGLTIDLIPSGVRKLELNGNWPKSDALFGRDGLTLKLNEYLPHLEVLDLHLISFESYAWMAHSPQSLTNLKILCWDGTVELPKSLIHFRACNVTLSTFSFVSKLPPSLETFFVNDLCGVELLVPLLPPSTRKLFLGYRPECSFGGISPRSLLEQLPKSLTWFQVPNMINFETNPELAALLPSTLTSLCVHSKIPCSAWHLLTQPLRKLSFNVSESSTPKISDSHGAQQKVEPLPFDSLPRSITKLELHSDSFAFRNTPAMFNQSYFPPQLTELSIDIQLCPETVKLLPSSLTSLKLKALCERVCKHLPNRLQRLTSSITLITPNLIKFLPKYLTFLHLSVASSKDLWVDYNTGETFDSIAKLADYSIHERCTSNNFDWKNHSPLPPALTYLCIDNARELGDTFLQHQQLPNLLSLSFFRSTNFTDLSILLLPPHLTTLDLALSSRISSRSFEHLPRGLTDLHLDSSESIFDCDIQHLPRTLKYVYLSHAIHLTDSCVPDLPPHLEWLYMRHNSQISPSSFPNFPYPIRAAHYYPVRTAHFANWSICRGVVQQYQPSKTWTCEIL